MDRLEQLHINKILAIFKKLSYYVTNDNSLFKCHYNYCNFQAVMKVISNDYIFNKIEQINDIKIILHYIDILKKELNIRNIKGILILDNNLPILYIKNKRNTIYHNLLLDINDIKEEIKKEEESNHTIVIMIFILIFIRIIANLFINI